MPITSAITAEESTHLTPSPPISGIGIGSSVGSSARYRCGIRPEAIGPPRPRGRAVAAWRNWANCCPTSLTKPPIGRSESE